MKPRLAEHLAEVLRLDAVKTQALLQEGAIPFGKLEFVHARLCDSCQLLATTGLPTKACAETYDQIDAITQRFAIAIKTREIH